MDVIELAMRRSRTVVLTLLVVLIGGLVAYATIPKEAEPDIEIPIVYVSIEHEGISPEDAERLLVKPMEIRLRTLEGLKEMTAYGATDHAGIFLEFDISMDMDQVLLDVREQVDIARAEIPQDSEEPIVREINFSEEPVIIAGIYGDVPERTMYNIARRAKDELESIKSVLSAELVGTREELVEVVVDPAKLETYNVSYA